VTALIFDARPGDPRYILTARFFDRREGYDVANIAPRPDTTLVRRIFIIKSGFSVPTIDVYCVRNALSAYKVSRNERRGSIPLRGLDMEEGA